MLNVHIGDREILSLNRKGRSHINIIRSGNSEIIAMPIYFKVASAIISNVQGGGVIMQYSLSSREELSEGNGVWHDWSLGEITSHGGIGIDSPVRFVRCVAQNSVSYRFEVAI